MTDTTNGYRALPWRSEGYRVYDADGIEVANTFTPELALGSAKAVAKDIAEAANANYVGKDARIAELERAVQDYRDHYVHRYLYEDLEKLKDAAELRAEAAEKRAEQAEIDRSELLKYYERYQEAAKRAEAAEDSLKKAEACLNLFLRYHNEDQEEISALRKRAEDAEARVRELEQYSTLGYTTREELPQETLTAPDGRVFRVGQRVWHIWDEPGEFGRVTDINGGFPLVRFQDAEDQTHPDNLRRVWDGEDAPNVPVGTVLRDSYGCYLERLSGTRWELQNEKGDPLDIDEWINLDSEQFRPYVEVLDGDV